MSNSVPDSSQTSIPHTSSEAEAAEVSPTPEENQVSKIRQYSSLLVEISTVLQALPTILILILIPILFFSFRDKMALDVGCITSGYRLGILAALGGTVGLTVLGVALAPAAILSILIWLFIKFSYFCG